MERFDRISSVINYNQESRLVCNTYIHQRFLSESGHGVATSGMIVDWRIGVGGQRQPPLVMKVGVGGQGRLRPAGLDVSGRVEGEVVDGVRPALRLVGGVDLTIVIAGGAVRSVLVSVNQSCHGVDALMRPGGGPRTLVSTAGPLPVLAGQALV